jgi:hypothetical protein
MVAKSREKELKLMRRTPEGWRGAGRREVEVIGSQLTIEPLGLMVRLVARDFVDKLCDQAEWSDFGPDGFGFSIPPITGETFKEIAQQARELLGFGGEETAEEKAPRKPQKKVSFLTRTSKMGCYSFNLPAGPPEFGGACPASGLGFLYRQEKHKHEHGAKETFEYPDWDQFVPNKQSEELTKVHSITKKKWICNACYALKGNYAYTTGVIGQMIKFNLVKRMLRPGGWKGRSFSSYMIEAIERARQISRDDMQGLPKELLHQVPHPDYFRIHDAGDFFREDYWNEWVKVMKHFKGMHFWAPTRMWVLQKPLRYLKHPPRNLALRPSALHFGDKSPVVPGLAIGSSSARPENMPPGIWPCPAYDQEHLGGGSGPQPVATYSRSTKTYTYQPGFYYCLSTERTKAGKAKYIRVSSEDLSGCKLDEDGKPTVQMEAGSCQRAHGPASPALKKRFLPVIQQVDKPIGQGGEGCRACWDTTTPVYYHEH